MTAPSLPLTENSSANQRDVGLASRPGDFCVAGASKNDDNIVGSPTSIMAVKRHSSRKDPPYEVSKKARLVDKNGFVDSENTSIVSTEGTARPPRMVGGMMDDDEEDTIVYNKEETPSPADDETPEHVTGNKEMESLEDTEGYSTEVATGMAEDSSGVEVQEDTEEAKQWLATIDELRESEDCQSLPQKPRIRLETFLKQLEINDHSTTAFEGYIREYNQTLRDEGSILQNAFAMVHDQCQNMLGNMDRDFIYAITHNHSERVKLLDKIQQAQSNYHKCTNRLMRRVDGDTTKSPEKTAEATTDTVAMSETSDQGLDPSHGEELTNEDPDWSKLEEHEPNRDKIDRFLRARDMKAQADMMLKETVDQVSAVLHDIERGTTDCLYDIMDKIEQEKTKPLHASLKYTIRDNHARRQENRQKLESTNQVARGFFANTMALLQRGAAFLTSSTSGSPASDKDERA